MLIYTSGDMDMRWFVCYIVALTRMCAIIADLTPVGSTLFSEFQILIWYGCIQLYRSNKYVPSPNFSVEEEVQTMVVRKSLPDDSKMAIPHNSKKYAGMEVKDLDKMFVKKSYDLQRIVEQRHVIRYRNYRDVFHSNEYDAFERAVQCKGLTYVI